MIINLARIRFGGSGGSSPAKPEDFFEETYTANGDYDVVPQTGHVFSGGTITVAVPSDQKPEDEFTELYEANGVYDITPESGHVFSAGQIEVDVHPTDKLTRTYTENDTYEISGEWTDAEITVAVPVPTEETLSETITENGLHTFTPTAGSVFSSVEIEADVHPENSLSLTITESGTYSSSDEFSGYEISVDVEGPKTEETLTETITANGTQIFTPTAGSVFDSAVITVDVPGITPTGTINISANGTYDVTDKATAVVAVGGTDYRYKTGTPDTIGLAAIGWDADSIGYYGANTPHYAWENGEYTVSQENINLYSLDDPQPDLYEDDPDVTFVPNKNMSSYFGTTSGYQAFYNMKNIKGIPLYDTSSMTSMAYMFQFCSSLQTIPLLDTGSVTSMHYMFKGCSSLTSIPPLDTGSVTSMVGMFDHCSSLQTIPQLDTSGVTDMQLMFAYCSSLQTIPLLDTGSVTLVTEMFDHCSSLQTIPQLDTSSVTYMSKMFQYCSSLQTIPPLDTGSVTSMVGMFDHCSSLQTIPQLDTSSVTNISRMFNQCNSLKTIPAINLSSATDASSMFEGCEGLTHLPALDTSGVTNMSNFINNFSERPNFRSVDGIDFSSVTSQPSSFFSYYDSPNLTHFIVNGKINFSWSTDNYGLQRLINLDYESVKSILEAMNRTDNTNAKTMKLNCVAVDREGELTALVASCATKGWTITGLNIKEQSVINSITPNIDHIVVSDIGGMLDSRLKLTIDTNGALQGGGYPNKRTVANNAYYQFDYYDAATDEKLRDGNTYTNSCYTPPSTSGTSEVTFYISSSSSRPVPQSGEYALVGITLKSASTPYEFVDYYFKVYPNGE